ncbi:MAG TPA: PTS sugar transporter subunit IIA [Thermoanaerobaculia bacterium]|jgi:mannitol/fructose-specific phosphotransferase system IIA component (Ntr-type)
MIETRLSELLNDQAVSISFSASCVEDAIPLLMGPALQQAGISEDQKQTIVDAIKKREECASTISPPLALPHTRHAAVSRIVAALGINRSGALEKDHDVQAVVSFVSPETASAEHLRFLAGVAKLFRTREAVDQLLEAQSPADVIEVLRRLGN